MDDRSITDSGFQVTGEDLVLPRASYIRPFVSTATVASDSTTSSVGVLSKNQSTELTRVTNSLALSQTHTWDSTVVGTVGLQLPPGYWKVDVSAYTNLSTAMPITTTCGGNYANYSGVNGTGELKCDDGDSYEETRLNEGAAPGYAHSSEFVRSTGYTANNLDTDPWTLGNVYRVIFPATKPWKVFIDAIPVSSARPWSDSELGDLRTTRLEERLKLLEKLTKKDMKMSPEFLTSYAKTKLAEAKVKGDEVPCGGASPCTCKVHLAGGH